MNYEIDQQDLDAYRYIKAINADATTSAAGGFSAMIAFVEDLFPIGSNAHQVLFASYAPSGGDFDRQLHLWLSTPTNANPPGLGLTANTSPNLALVHARLRDSAYGQGF